MKELSIAVLGDGRWARALTGVLTNNQNRQRGHIKRVMHCSPPRAAEAPPSSQTPAAVKADSEDETIMGISAAALTGLATSLPDIPPRDSVNAGSEDATMMGLTAGSLADALATEAAPAVELHVDLGEVASADLILLTVAPSGVRALLRKLRPVVRPQQMIIHCIDGICPPDPGAEQPPMTVSDVIRQETQLTRIGALAGPARPEDLEEWNPAALVCGSPSESVVAAARQVLCSPTLRVYGTNDLIGVEVARAMCSVIALASGVCDVLEFGAATRATLVSRSAAESARLGMALGGHERTFLGLAGFGGFMLASEHQSSCDFELGRLLGASVRLPQAQKRLGRACDSVETVRDVYSLSESHGLRTPILTTIHRLLFSGEEVPKLVKGLLEDPTSVE